MSKRRDKHHHGHQSTDHLQEPPGRDRADPGLVYAVRFEPSSDDRDRYADEKNCRHSQLSLGKWLNGITAVGTAVAIAGLAALYGTLQATKKSADAARRAADTAATQMSVAERAWLKISYGKPIIAEGKPISIPVSIANIGRTAARKVIVHTVVQVVDNTPAGGAAIKFAYDVPHESYSSGYIMPNDPDAVHFLATTKAFGADGKSVQNAPLSHAAATQISRSSEFVIVYSEAVYWDVFGVQHWTRFCQYVRPPDDLAYALKCTSYDDVDSNYGRKQNQKYASPLLPPD